ncbi:MAG: VCBS repeat-containing protein [Polyangiaceae bacterium]
MPSAPLRRRVLAVVSCSIALVVVGPGLTGACKTLEDLNVNVCGNRVLDQGEDCDRADELVVKRDGATDTYKCIAAGEVDACHYAVCETCVEECPDGFRAGLDDACHRPSAVFVETLSVPFTGIEPHVIDIDNDKRNDILINAHDREQIAFMGDGFIRSTYAIRKALASSPTIGEVGVRPDTPDILLPTGPGNLDGFAVFAGVDNAPPEAFTFPAYSLGNGFRVIPASAELFGEPAHADVFTAGLLLNCADNAPDGICEAPPHGLGAKLLGAQPLVFPGADPVIATTDMNLGEPFADPAKPLVDVEFRHDHHAMGQPCTDTLVGFVGATPDRLRLLSPCDPRDPLMTPDGRKIELLKPRNLSFPPMLATCKLLSLKTGADPATGYGEVFANFDCGKPTDKPKKTLVARLVFDASAVPAASFVEACPGCVLPALPCSADDARTLIGVGDMNGDGFLDYAASDGIFLGGPMAGIQVISQTMPYQTPTTPCGWTGGLMNDVNDDGLADLVAIPAADAGITVVLGSKNSILPSMTLGTDVKVSHVLAADFDGDGPRDIAVALDSFATESCEAQRPADIALFFGRKSGFPEDAQIIGHVDGLKQFDGGVLYKDSTGVASDAFADLAAISSPKSGGCVKDQGALFSGSPDRTIVTPYNMKTRAIGKLSKGVLDIKATGLFSFPDPADASKKVSFIGFLMNSDDTKYGDLVQTGYSAEGVWSASPGCQGNMDCAELKELSDLPPGRMGAAAMFQLDDAVVFAVTQPDGTTVNVRRFDPATKAVVDLVGFQAASSVARLEITAGDFDQDGKVDAAITAFTIPGPHPANGPVTMHLYANHELDGDTSDPGSGCTVSVATDAQPIGLTLADVGRVRPDDAARAFPVIAFATASKILMLDSIASAGDGALCTITPSKIAPPTQSLAGDIQSIAAGDVDGDGIDDLVIAGHDRIVIASQLQGTQFDLDDDSSSSSSTGE